MNTASPCNLCAALSSFHASKWGAGYLASFPSFRPHSEKFGLSRQVRPYYLLQRKIFFTLPRIVSPGRIFFPQYKQVASQ